MKIKVIELVGTKDETVSAVFIDDQFICYGLEDEERKVKVMGETRIPGGEYTVTFRKEGGHHARYLEKFGAEFHRGMLWVRDVVNFKWILIHIGNTDEDTGGCLLVGLTHNGKTIGESTNAYKKLYPIVAGAMVNGEQVTIEYIRK